MTYFKTERFDPITLKNEGVFDTEIPQELVDVIQKALTDSSVIAPSSVRWITTPVMTNPNLKEISFGILTPSVNGSQFKYVVSIKTKEYWDDIYNRLKTAKNESSGDNSLPATPDSTL